eukprot:Hpha_TRINITY_DN5306_c0_g1::TRINITY_DN5306_c0_g1_i1::g.32836::m.32836
MSNPAARVLCGWWRGPGNGSQGKCHEVVSFLHEPRTVSGSEESKGEKVLRVRHESFRRPLSESGPDVRARLEQGFAAFPARGDAQMALAGSSPQGTSEPLTSEQLRCTASGNANRRTAQVVCEGTRQFFSENAGGAGKGVRVRRTYTVEEHTMGMKVEEAGGGGEWTVVTEGTLKHDNVNWRDVF